MPDEPEKPKLRPAATNPWYVLMTVAGEQPGGDRFHIDRNLHVRNRRYWNGWQAQALSGPEKAKLIDDGRATEADLADLTEEERAAIDKALAHRCPSAKKPDPKNPVDLRSTEFTSVFCANGFLFPTRTTFRDVTFSLYAGFDGATFSRLAGFRNAAFKSATSFGPLHDATRTRPVLFLSEPPEFFGATLHENTDFTDVVWPPMPDDSESKERRARAIRHRQRYERLKLLMDSQKKVADELMFQRLELRCREAEAVGDWRTREWWVARASRLFGVLSDYGWDPVKPVLYLGGLLVVGWILIFLAEWGDYFLGAWPDPTQPPEYLGFWQSGALSFSNLFGFLGLNRTFLREEIATLTAFSEVLSALQTIAGLILLFLFGLALRNRFRIK